MIMESTNEKRIYEVAEIQLTYRTEVKPSLRPRISGSRDAYNVLLENWDKSKLEFIEQFKVMLLNRANKVLGIFEVSSGSSTGTVADLKLLCCGDQNQCMRNYPDTQSSFRQPQP
jgi:DNA repair protein RadC